MEEVIDVRRFCFQMTGWLQTPFSSVKRARQATGARPRRWRVLDTWTDDGVPLSGGWGLDPTDVAVVQAPLQKPPSEWAGPLEEVPGHSASISYLTYTEYRIHNFK